MKALGKAFDIKGMVAAFGEAFDLKGCIAGFREAFDLGDAARSFAAGFRDGAKLLTGHFRWARAALHSGRRHAETLQGHLLLERLLADVAGGGGAAVRALGEIRTLLRPYNPRIDAIPDEHVPALVKRILEDLEKPAARPEDFTGAVARALAEAQAKAAALDFADAARGLDEALAQTKAEDQHRARGRAALLAERGRVARLQLRYREAAGFYQQAAAVAFDPLVAWVHMMSPLVAWVHMMSAASAYYAQGEEFGDNAALVSAIEDYRSALGLAPRERAPLEWATTLNNLGNALQLLGERESGVARLAPLRDAVAAFDAALSVFAEERALKYAEGCRANRERAMRLLEERAPTRPSLRLRGRL